MENLSPQPTLDPAANRTWGATIQTWICSHCDWTFATSKPDPVDRCPHCFQNTLVQGDAALGELPVSYPPELVIPFNLSTTGIDTGIKNFAGGIPFSPTDLNPSNLLRRLRRLFLPIWLVDSRVNASWKAEMGFYYQVVSHLEKYEQNRDRWITHEVQETRTRWELRLGRLERNYQNIPVPALDNQKTIQKQIGNFDTKHSKPFQPEIIQDSFIRLPNRSIKDAWMDALPAFQNASAEECRQAASADMVRQYSWKPIFKDENWTLLLLPVYSSYYLDDQKIPQPVYINGQNGTISGIRKSSQKRAQKAAITIFIVAILIFFLGLILAGVSLAFPSALLIAGIFGGLAFFVALGAILPFIVVWWFNRNEAKTPILES